MKLNVFLFILQIKDILNENINYVYDIVHDKGTYDAISLYTDTKKNRELYIEKVYQLLSPQGFFIITSCNWTKLEIEEHFKQKLCIKEIIPTPQFSFGGISGNTITSLIFVKKESLS